MRPFVIVRYISMGLLLNAVFMLIATTVSTLNHFDDGFFPLLLSFLVTTAMGAFPLFFVPSYRDISLKESYVIVAFSWILCCAIGMLPYLLSGRLSILVNEVAPVVVYPETLSNHAFCYR